jgi:hypothetical protein
MVPASPGPIKYHHYSCLKWISYLYFTETVSIFPTSAFGSYSSISKRNVLFYLHNCDRKQTIQAISYDAGMKITKSETKLKEFSSKS